MTTSLLELFIAAKKLKITQNFDFFLKSLVDFVLIVNAFKYSTKGVGQFLPLPPICQRVLAIFIVMLMVEQMNLDEFNYLHMNRWINAS